uniref:Uncharacterized protein n=1 Tax=Arundo donax TaxID=35708 RepID=A0A0A8ZYQ2_ARUDO
MTNIHVKCIQFKREKMFTARDPQGYHIQKTAIIP